MFIARFLPVLLIVLIVSSAATAQIRVRVKFGEISNLTYQLDCVSDLPVHCSRQNLGDLWTREFLKTEEDRQMLKEWARLRDRYSKNIELPKGSGWINVFDKVRVAGFQAESAEDYATRLDLLTTPADRSSFERVIKHFGPRFRLWWQREAVTAGDGFARQTGVLLRSPKISTDITRFYNFYRTALPDNYEIGFNLFYVPNTVKEASSGQQLENHSLMEFKANESPAQRIDIAVHELCHFFYENMKPEDRAALEKSFRTANRAGAVPALNLMNETLAAAFGNGMIARAVTPPAEFAKYLAAPKSFYNNASIDRAAKAILPMLDEHLKAGKNIGDAKFVDDYISVLEKTFGEDLLRPKYYLSEMFLFVDGKYAVSMRRDVRRVMETASLYSVEADWTKEGILDDYKNYPHLNSLFIVHPDNLGEIAKNKIVTEAQLAAMQNEYKANRQVIFGTERAPFTYIYIVVAKDAEGAKSLIGKLSEAGKFQGVYKVK